MPPKKGALHTSTSVTDLSPHHPADRQRLQELSPTPGASYVEAIQRAESERRHGAHQRGALLEAVGDDHEPAPRPGDQSPYPQWDSSAWRAAADTLTMPTLTPPQVPTRNILLDGDENNDVQWRPNLSNTPAQNDINQAILDQFRQMGMLLQGLVPHKQNTAPEAFFSGRDHEDPELFLRSTEGWFRQNQIPASRQSKEFEKCIQGEVLKWYKNVGAEHFDWPYLANLIRDHYNSTAHRTRLLQALYGKTQGRREKAEEFIHDKWSLFNRLSPATGPLERIEVIRELLTPELRAYTRTTCFTSLRDFVWTMSKLERDLEDARGPRLQQTSSRPPPTPTQRSQQPNPNQTKSSPPYPCRHCGGDHYNNSCPSTKQGNAQAAAVQPNSTRPAQTIHVNQVEVPSNPSPTEAPQPATC